MLTELGCHSGSETCSGQSAAADDDLSNVPIAGGGASWTAGGAADAGSGHAGRSARILLSALRDRGAFQGETTADQQEHKGSLSFSISD